MKKIFLLSTILLVAPVVALAQGFVPLAPITGLTDTNALSVVNSNGLASFFNNLYKFAIGIAAALAVIQIIWAGLDIAIFHKDAVGAITDDKGKIYNAVFGLVLVLSPVLVFSIINPSILNLSLNLPELKTASGSPTGPGGGTGAPVAGAPDPASGCTSVVGTPGILQIATCPTSNAATTWSQKNCTSGNNLFTGPTNKLTDGTIVSTVLICAGTQNYVFVDLSSGVVGRIFDSFTYLSDLQPLAITSLNPSNAVSVLQFADTCSSIGWETCLSDRPLLTSSFSCAPTPQTRISSGVSGKCYNEKLSCENVGINTKLSELCSKSPGWTPFQ